MGGGHLPEGILEKFLRIGVDIDHERDVLDGRLRVLVEKPHDTADHLADSFFLRLLDHAEHDAHADRGKCDGFEACLRSGGETVQKHFAKRALEVVDDEDHIAELTVVLLAVAFGDDGCTMLERKGLSHLVVEQIASRTSNRAIDTSEPHAARIDGSDEGIAAGLGQVARDDIHFTFHRTEPFA